MKAYKALEAYEAFEACKALKACNALEACKALKACKALEASAMLANLWMELILCHFNVCPSEIPFLYVSTILRWFTKLFDGISLDKPIECMRIHPKKIFQVWIAGAS